MSLSHSTSVFHYSLVHHTSLLALNLCQLITPPGSRFQPTPHSFFYLPIFTSILHYYLPAGTNYLPAHQSVSSPQATNSIHLHQIHSHSFIESTSITVYSPFSTSTNSLFGCEIPLGDFFSHLSLALRWYILLCLASSSQGVFSFVAIAASSGLLSCCGSSAPRFLILSFELALRWIRVLLED